MDGEFDGDHSSLTIWPVRRPLEWVDRWALLTTSAMLMAPAGSILLAAATPLSFRTTLLIAAPIALCATLALFRLSRTSVIGRRSLIGLAAGLGATVAYDLVRLVLQAIDLVADPFRAIALYGQSLVVGSTLGPALGWAYHAWNGLTFAMFFVVAFRQPTVWKGLLWALSLNTLQSLTIGTVPGLPVGREFLTASITGHLAYGVTLGWVAKVMVERWAVGGDG